MRARARSLHSLRCAAAESVRDYDEAVNAHLAVRISVPHPEPQTVRMAAFAAMLSLGQVGPELAALRFGVTWGSCSLGSRHGA